MKVTIVCVGKLKEKYWKDAIAEYSKRLSRYMKLEIIELADEKAPETMSPAQEAEVKEKEGQRILGENGHLSNVAAGELLAEIMSGKMKYVFLGHLSEDNNNPHLAFETVEEILRKKQIEVGTHIKMDMASRFRNGVKVEL